MMNDFNQSLYSCCRDKTWQQVWNSQVFNKLFWSSSRGLVLHPDPAAVRHLLPTTDAKSGWWSFLSGAVLSILGSGLKTDTTRFNWLWWFTIQCTGPLETRNILPALCESCFGQKCFCLKTIYFDFFHVYVIFRFRLQRDSHSSSGHFYKKLLPQSQCVINKPQFDTEEAPLYMKYCFNIINLLRN